MTPGELFGLGDDGGEFTELYDADIDRVDLVGKGANGLPFLIAKSDAGTMPAEFVRSLLKKENLVAPPPVHKAKADDLTPVYDSKGTLVGLVPVGKIQTLSPPPLTAEEKAQAKAQSAVAANAAAVQARVAGAPSSDYSKTVVEPPPVDEDDDVAKALFALADGMRNVPLPPYQRGSVIKSTAGAGTFDSLCKSAGDDARIELQNAASLLALRLTGRGVPMRDAVRVAKGAIVKLAAAEQVRRAQRPGKPSPRAVPIA